METDTLQIKEALLAASLEVGVMLAIADLKANGGPSEADLESARSRAEVIAVADSILYRQDRRTAPDWAVLTRALAVLAFQPGGVKFCGMHWKVEDSVKCLES